MADPPPGPFRRIGHKGADSIVPGNTLESFSAAVEAGVDAIELDVLRPRSDFAKASDWRVAEAGPAPPAERREPLLVAHDWGDAKRRDPLTLTEVLTAFTAPPFDGVEIDLDLKVAGREDEVIAALDERGLTARAMISTMELDSLAAVRELAPALRAGWTYPRTTRAWDRKRWARPALLGALWAMRRRLPRLASRQLPELGAWAMWVYHPLITPALVEACHGEGTELIAWTVDDPERMARLLDYGVDGICSNDPRLFASLGGAPKPSREPHASAPLTPGRPS